MGSSVTVLVLLGGLYQYWRSQLWRRAEFVAAEMKSFFADKQVRKVTLMVDWAKRNINLFDEEGKKPAKWPLVSRDMQRRALLLHTLAASVLSYDPETSAQAADSDLAVFSLQEAAIRDAYDGFLDGLERLSSYVSSGLVTVEDLRPYLQYWMDDIPRKGSDSDNEWTCMLLSYISFYSYRGVQRLFRAFDQEVIYGSDLFEFYLNGLKDQKFAAQLREQLEAQLVQTRSDGN